MGLGGGGGGLTAWKKNCGIRIWKGWVSVLRKNGAKHVTRLEPSRSCCGASADSAGKRSHKGNRFRGITAEPGFDEICRKSDREAIRVLAEYNLLPARTARVCWKCGDKMKNAQYKYKGENHRMRIRCKNASCRAQLHPLRAYSPLHNSTMSYSSYLRLCWTFAYEMRQDQARALNRGAALGEDIVSRTYAILRDITAYVAVASTRDVTFSNGEVDTDAKVTHMRRDVGCDNPPAKACGWNAQNIWGQRCLKFASRLFTPVCAPLFVG